ncbi:hypothetical protein ABZ646_37390 [Streptomyces sp. NPDC007162]|uniref:hypothetical protein n=1 Tax=Streptomyces sp. NPDC007162 TaxID=3156917 RepID=UPI0033C08F0E
MTGIRMIGADLLKLYRRRSLMVWSAVLFVGAQLLFYGVGAARHAALMVSLAFTVPAVVAAAGGAVMLAGPGVAPTTSALVMSGLGP